MRQHQSITVQGWTSAHVYIGTSLLATLRAFEFAWNVHALACALMIVVARGFFGVYAYNRYPEMLTANLAGYTVR